MRLVRFGGAMSLDGYIAGPNGEYDWIVIDPDIDFAETQSQFDTFLIGRKTLDSSTTWCEGTRDRERSGSVPRSIYGLAWSDNQFKLKPLVIATDRSRCAPAAR